MPGASIALWFRQFRIRKPNGLRFSVINAPGTVLKITNFQNVTRLLNWESMGTDSKNRREPKSSLTSLRKEKEELHSALENLHNLIKCLPGIVYQCSYEKDRLRINFLSEGRGSLLDPQMKHGNSDFPRSFNDMVPEEDRIANRKAIDKSLAKKKPYKLYYRLKTSKGQMKWVWEQGEGLYNPDGEVIGLQGFITDISEQKMEEFRLKNEYLRLKSSLKDRYRLGAIIGRSQRMQHVYDLIIKAAESDAPVLITGETGTGKELAARAIHDLSRRSSAAFVPVNCGAIPESLIESEFFGYKKGAFTGATRDKEGYFDIANGGTLFLDEIGEINESIQVKLLRAIEGYGYTPVGGHRIKKADVRIIAASNKNIREHIRKGLIRTDFFFRISVLPILIPPLRERAQDIPLIAEHILKRYGYDDNMSQLPYHVLDIFAKYDWPGNVRELINVLERFMVFGYWESIEKLEMSLKKNSKFKQLNINKSLQLRKMLSQYEKYVILETLKENNWRVAQTASALGISTRSLSRKIKQYQLKLTQ